ncbi:phage holin family protein [Planctomycetota bacterium]
MLAVALKWMILTLVFLGVASMLPTVTIRSRASAVGAAAVFGVANVLLGWFVAWFFGALLLLPAVLTLGLAWLLVPLLVNMVLLALTDALLDDAIEIKGIGPLAALAMAVTVAMALMQSVA